MVTDAVMSDGQAAREADARHDDDMAPQQRPISNAPIDLTGQFTPSLTHAEQQHVQQKHDQQLQALRSVHLTYSSLILIYSSFTGAHI